MSDHNKNRGQSLASLGLSITVMSEANQRRILMVLEKSLFHFVPRAQDVMCPVAVGMKRRLIIKRRQKTEL